MHPAPRLRGSRATGADASAPQAALAHFRAELASHKTTLNYLQVAYDEPLPEDLIRKIAKYQLKLVRERQDDAFW